MKKSTLILSVMLALSLLLQAQNEDAKKVTIGTQTWMTDNLTVSQFRNGDPVKQARTFAEWKKAGESKQPAWCYYQNNTTYGSQLGKLYNWYAVNDPRGLAPAGWHIATAE